jgi:hypothetical protein
LAPTSALVTAAFAVPVLLLFYLLKLRRRPVRVSSTLLWTQAVHDLQVNTPFRWLRPTALFLLQAAILALFLAALARPVLDMPHAASARVLILIDRSASMSARDVPGAATRLDAAKETALRMVDEYARGGSPAVGVIAFAADARLASPLSQDLGATRDAIKELPPTDQPADFGAALRLAAGLLGTNTDESEARQSAQVALLSDGNVARPQSISLPGAEFRFRRIGPPPGPAGWDNLGIVAFAARREWDDPASTRIFVRVINAGTAPVTAALVLTLDGQEIDRRALTVPGSPAPSTVDQPAVGEPAPSTPGEGTTIFTVSSRAGGVIRARIERPDLLAADDEATVVLPAASKPRILLVEPDATDPPAPDTTWVLKDVLTELQLPLRVTTLSAFNQEPPEAIPADLVIFDGVRPARIPLVPSISFGAGLPGLPPDSGPRDRGGTAFIAWDRTHPVLRDVALDSVYIGPRIGLPTAREPTVVGNVVELARDASGPLMVEIEAAGLRRLMVAFRPADSTWPLTFGFPIFLASAIDRLAIRPESRSGVMFTTGVPTEVQARPGQELATLDGPATIVAHATQPGTGPLRLNFGLIERAGVYREPGAAGSMVVPVNLLSPLESSMAELQTITVAGSTLAPSTAGREPRELWPWLVLAALALLCIEWTVTAALQRV